MNALFEKLESAKVDVLELLQPEDKTFCKNMFTFYESHVSFIQNILQTMIEKYGQHQKQTPISADDFYYEICKMEKSIAGFREIIFSLHQKITRKIETHFEDSYNIIFSSFIEKIEHESQLTEIMLEEIIDNMIEQAGADLRQAGKDQVIERFQKLFYTASQQPELKNSNIGS